MMEVAEAFDGIETFEAVRQTYEGVEVDVAVLNEIDARLEKAVDRADTLLAEVAAAFHSSQAR